MVISPQRTMTPAIITAIPGAGRGSPARTAASIALHRRRATAAVTTPARISRTPTVSHAQRNVCPDRSRAAATPEATSASDVRSHARYVRSFASWNCTSGPRRSLTSAPHFQDVESVARADNEPRHLVRQLRHLARRLRGGTSAAPPVFFGETGRGEPDARTSDPSSSTRRVPWTTDGRGRGGARFGPRQWRRWVRPPGDGRRRDPGQHPELLLRSDDPSCAPGRHGDVGEQGCRSAHGPWCQRVVGQLQLGQAQRGERSTIDSELRRLSVRLHYHAGMIGAVVVGTAKAAGAAYRPPRTPPGP